MGIGRVEQKPCVGGRKILDSIPQNHFHLGKDGLCMAGVMQAEMGVVQNNIFKISEQVLWFRFHVE